MQVVRDYFQKGEYVVRWLRTEDALFWEQACESTHAHTPARSHARTFLYKLTCGFEKHMT